MHNDEVIWQVLGGTFCSFKAKILNDVFCRNTYNVTGKCNRVSCPLANGYYATVIEEEGKCYLYCKTIERAHLPRKMWEKTELSDNYQQALLQIDSAMKHIYKDHQINRCKQRLTRLRQTLIRMRQMQVVPQPRLLPVKQKTERREATREKKAEIAARLEISIEQELLNRLKKGVYGDVYNYDREAFENVLKEKEILEEEEEEEEEEDEDFNETEFIEDDDDIELEDIIDSDELLAATLRRDVRQNSIDEQQDYMEDDTEKSSIMNKKKSVTFNNLVSTNLDSIVDSNYNDNQQRKKRKFAKKGITGGPRVEIEYEYEDDNASKILI